MKKSLNAENLLFNAYLRESDKFDKITLVKYDFKSDPHK
jgi:hypothetical protein